MTRLILVDEYWDELDRINLYGCEERDDIYLEMTEYTIQEDNEKELNLFLNGAYDND